jgi:hypothetical protein
MSWRYVHDFLYQKILPLYFDQEYQKRILCSNLKSAMVVTDIHHLNTKVDYCTPAPWNLPKLNHTKCNTWHICSFCAHWYPPFDIGLCRFLSLWRVVKTQKQWSILLLHNWMKLLHVLVSLTFFLLAEWSFLLQLPNVECFEICISRLSHTKTWYFLWQKNIQERLPS